MRTLCPCKIYQNRVWDYRYLSCFSPLQIFCYVAMQNWHQEWWCERLIREDFLWHRNGFIIPTPVHPCWPLYLVGIFCTLFWDFQFHLPLAGQIFSVIPHICLLCIFYSVSFSICLLRIHSNLPPFFKITSLMWFLVTCQHNYTVNCSSANMQWMDTLNIQIK